MKKKITIAVLLAMALLLTVGCGSADSKSSAAGQTEAEQNATAEQNAPAEQTEQNGRRIMARVTAVDGTTVSYESFSMPAGQDGEHPEMPQGEKGERPEMPEGQNGEMPEMPEGGFPEKPEGQDGERPEMPQGEKGERPEMPQGQNGDRPEMPEGGDFKGESGSVTVSDTSILFKRDNGQETAAELSDIAVGSMLELTEDADGNVTRIVISTMGGQPGAPENQN